MKSEQQTRIPQVLLCVALSLLLHILLGALLLLPPPQESLRREHKGTRKARPVKITRTAARKKADTAKQPVAPAPGPNKPAEPKPFAKTSTDTPRALPDQPEYEGKRDTRAASAPDARHLASAAQAPAMTGEQKDEVVTFDQERQEGEMGHEAKGRPAPQPQAAEPEPAPLPPEPPAPAPADGAPEGSNSPDAQGKDAEDTRIDATQALTLTPELSGELKLQQEPPPLPAEKEQQAARKGTPGGTGQQAPRPARPRQSRMFYDPSLAEWAQPQKPGFRTHERRSRSSGRFIFGSGAALNVASTPRGEYEALVYRRVARFWYIACDEHRGDIIPGKITISLRITRHGQIDSMALIRRSGASISQQSFTFKAIRKASLPPMPPEVQADVIGPLMELIFEFNFD